MKKISIMIMVLVVALASCKKTPEVNLKYVDVERDLVTVGTTTANIQCDYDYIATLKKAYLYYGEGENEDDFTSAEMRVVQNTLYVELTGLKPNTTYGYFYEFHNGFNSMRTALKSFKTESSPGSVTLPTVITSAVTDITATSAKSGGEVTNDGGAEVTERGICWNTNANPTLDDSHITAGTGTGAFTAMMASLQANTTYHVRAYAINEKGTAYGLDREFKTPSGGGGSGDYVYVDLGLPSGTLWATCNVGANSPEEYGDYFAWGETSLKEYYDWSTYKYCKGSDNTLIKYCTMAELGYNGFTDQLTELLTEDDVATLFMGPNWRMPTLVEWEELLRTTVSTWTSQNGVYGRLFTAVNGNSIFLPAAGWRCDTICNAAAQGLYWGNYCFASDPKRAGGLNFSNDDCLMVASERSHGYTVRPVCNNNTPTPPSGVPQGAIDGLFSVSPTQKVYFSQGNLQYQASTNTWRFAEHQWDYVGDDNSNISSNYSEWIDLFGWGTSGWNNGNFYYHPWDAYDSDCSSYGPPELANLYGSYINSDWGHYNAISNGGNQTQLWYTLSDGGWTYILNVRNTASGIRYAKANVNNVNGVILLPDNWNSSTYNLNSTNQSEASYSSNTISSSQWDMLENTGAVFLPAAGFRNGTSISNIGLSGTYWSSEFALGNTAWNLYFYGSNLDASNSDVRCFGLSVRLVSDVNP